MPYPASVKAVYKFEGNANDTLGNYNATTNATFSTVQKKYGTYSLTNNGVTNHSLILPSTLENDLAVEPFWTVQFWFYPTSPLAGYQNDVWQAKGNYPWTNPAVWIALRNMTSNDYDLDCVVGNGHRLTGDWTGVTRNDWHLLSLEYDSSTSSVLMYIDGIVRGSTSGVASSPMVYNSGLVWYFLDNVYHSNDNCPNGYMDNLIVTNALEGGQEVLEIIYPTVTDVSPATGYTTGGDTVTITGTGFLIGATVTFGSDNATDVSVLSSISLTCKTPSHIGGVVDVTVTNTDTGTYTKPNAFFYSYPYAPIIYSLSPTTKEVGIKTLVYIYGENFFPNPAVSFGTISATNIIWINSTTVSCVAPEQATTGKVTVFLTNTDLSTCYLVDSFLYVSVFKPTNNVKLFCNGNDITQFLIKRTIETHELNVLTKYDISFDDITFDVPFSATEQVVVRNDLTDKITMTKNGITFFIGFIKEQKIDFSTEVISYTSTPIFFLTNKKEAIFMDKSPVAVLNQLYNLFSLALPQGYTISPSIFNYKSEVPDIAVGIYPYTNTNSLNIMSTILSLLELIDFGVYFEGTEIHVCPLSKYPTTAFAIDGIIQKQLSLSQLQSFMFNKINVNMKQNYSDNNPYTYTATASATQELSKTYEASDFFGSATTGNALANRKLLLYNNLYYESNFVVPKDTEIMVGDYVSYKQYIFLVTKTEAGTLTTKVSVLGLKKN